MNADGTLREWGKDKDFPEWAEQVGKRFAPVASTPSVGAPAPAEVPTAAVSFLQEDSSETETRTAAADGDDMWSVSHIMSRPEGRTDVVAHAPAVPSGPPGGGVTSDAESSSSIGGEQEQASTAEFARALDADEDIDWDMLGVTPEVEAEQKFGESCRILSRSESRRLDRRHATQHHDRGHHFPQISFDHGYSTMCVRSILSVL